MGRLIELKAANTTILVESSDLEGGLVQAGAVEAVETRLDRILEVMKPFCESLVKNFESLGKYKPDSASAEFGLSFTAEGSVYFVKASGQASIKVTLNWGKP